MMLDHVCLKIKTAPIILEESHELYQEIFHLFDRPINEYLRLFKPNDHDLQLKISPEYLTSILRDELKIPLEVKTIYLSNDHYYFNIKMIICIEVTEDTLLIYESRSSNELLSLIQELDD